MPKFPALTDKQIIKKLRKAGFRFYKFAKLKGAMKCGLEILMEK